MEITQYRKVSEKINLTEEAVDLVTINRLRRFLDGGEYLRKHKNGELFLAQDDPNWRHGSVSEEIVRKATELDIAIFKVLEAIKNSP